MKYFDNIRWFLHLKFKYVLELIRSQNQNRDEISFQFILRFVVYDARMQVLSPM